MRVDTKRSVAIAFIVLVFGVTSCGDGSSSSGASPDVPEDSAVATRDEVPGGDDPFDDTPIDDDASNGSPIEVDPSQGGPLDGDAPDDIDALVEEVRAMYDMPAMGGAVVTADGLVAFGVAGERRAGGPLVTDEDRWHIGSNLKAITAFLAGIAVDAGVIGWESTVADSFPELAVAESYRDVTLRDLVTNRSGLPRDAFEAPLTATDARGQRDEVAVWAFEQPPVVPRGTFHYSNLGFAMAGAMIERAYGSTYEDVIDTELFAPIGVRHHGWGPQTEAGASDDPVPHFLGDDGWVPCEGCDNPPWLSAAGRLHLPLGEWALVIREMLRADDGRSALVSAATGRLLFEGEVALDGDDEYGYGWFVTTRGWAGGTTLNHDGSNLYNHSVAWVAPERELALLAVTNAADFHGGWSFTVLDALIQRLLAHHDGSD